jgi:hypothetical protein
MLRTCCTADGGPAEGDMTVAVAWPGDCVAAVDGERSAAGEPAVAGSAAPLGWVPGFADGAAVGQGDGEAASLEGHARPVTVTVPLASRNLAAVVVVAKERAATATPAAITPSAGHARAWPSAVWWRPDPRAGMAPLT